MSTVEKTSRPKSESKVDIEAFLLQRYQAYLYRVIVTKIFYRIVCLATTGFVVTVSSLSTIQAEASLIVAIFIGAFWYYEQYSLNAYMRRLERTIARRGSDELEDFYIESSYITTNYNLARNLKRLEPIFWSLLIVILTLMRFYIQRKTGLSS